jgi:hypothetical protein
MSPKATEQQKQREGCGKCVIALRLGCVVGMLWPSWTGCERDHTERVLLHWEAVCYHECQDKRWPIHEMDARPVPMQCGDLLVQLLASVHHSRDVRSLLTPAALDCLIGIAVSAQHSSAQVNILAVALRQELPLSSTGQGLLLQASISSRSVSRSEPMLLHTGPRVHTPSRPVLSFRLPTVRLGSSSNLGCWATCAHHFQE